MGVFLTAHDKRRFPRRSLEVDIQVGSRQVGGECLFETTNVCEGGVFLTSELLLAVGETFGVAFTIPGTEVQVHSRVRVVWVNRSPDENDPTARPGMGVEFLDMSPEERAALSDYLSQL